MYLKKLKNDLIPFNEKIQAIILLIIACVFQFLLFFSPQLANEAVARDNNRMINLASLSKSNNMDDSVLNYIENKQVFKNPYITIKEEPIENEEVEEIIEKEEIINEVYVVSTSVHAITAYNSLPEQTNCQPCITANGFNVCEHGIEDTIAANFLHFGTKVRIPELFGDRVFIVRDRMNKRYPNRVDIWMLERDDAIEFGIRRAKIEVIDYN